MTAQTAAKHAAAPQTPSLPQAKPESLGLSPVRLQRMSDAFKREIDKGTLPGVTVMVARRGQIGWFEALGRQSPAAAAPMAQDTIFRIFSMTKPIVSVGIMMLVEDGHFLLSDPVAKFIPEFADQKVGVENNGKLDLVPLKRPITIQDLLRHTSGITYDHTGNGLVQQLYQQSRLRSRKISNAEHAAMVAGLPLMCQPGAEWNYSRSTDILGRVIEVVSGKTPRRFPHRAHPGAAADGRDRVSHRRGERRPPRRAVRDRSLDRRQGAALQHAGEAGDGIRRRRPGLDHDGLCAVLPDAAQRRHARRQQDHRPQDAGADGVRSSRPQRQGRLAADAAPATASASASRCAPHEGMAPFPGSVGQFFWSGMAGTFFWIDPAEDLFAVFMMQGPGQREYIRTLLRNLVYAAVE